MKKDRLQKLKDKYQNKTRLYNRSIRMANKYSKELDAIHKLISKLENKRI